MNNVINLIAMPIGNMDDISVFGVEALKKSDVIICEDTRKIINILKHHNIDKKQFIVVNKFNENNPKLHKSIFEKIQNSESISWVSDAGYPLICDPGYKVRKYLELQNFTFKVISGPSSILSALLMSGFPCYPFYFLGFLNNKITQKKKELEKIHKLFQDTTIVIFESVHRIYSTLEEILKVFGDIEVCICREISKTYEQVYKNRVQEIIENKLILEKGEFVIVFRN